MMLFGMSVRMRYELLTKLFLVGALTGALVSGCDNDTSKRGELDIGIPAPVQSQQLTTGILQVFVTVDDGSRIPLTVDTTTNRFSGEITVSSGTHAYRVILEFIDDNFGILQLAEASSTTSDRVVTFITADYVFPDDDGDGFSNLVEIKARTNPGDVSDFPPRMTEVGLDDFRISDMGVDGDASSGVDNPAIAYNSTDNEYLVVWRGFDGESVARIYGQRLDAMGNGIGDNDFRIGDQGTLPPRVAYNALDNEYIVVWYEADTTKIRGQLLASSGAEIGTNDFTVSGVSELIVSSPRVTYNNVDNEYLIVWENDIGPDEEIRGQGLTASGNTVGPDFLIGSPGVFPKVVYNANHEEYLVAWWCEGVCLQRLDNSLSGLGDTTTVNRVLIPWALAYNATRSEYLVLSASRSSFDVFGPNDVFGLRLDASGDELATDFRVNDVPEFSVFIDAIYNPADTEYLVVWFADSSQQVFAQRLDAVGTELDIDLSIHSTASRTTPAVAHNSTDGEYLVVWKGDMGAGEFEILGQRLTIQVP